MVSCSSLLFHHLFAVSDRLMELAKSNEVSVDNKIDLRNEKSIIDSFQLFTSFEADKFNHNIAETKSAIENAGLALASAIDRIANTKLAPYSTSRAKSAEDELMEANLLNQKLTSEQVGYQSEIELLKNKLKTMKEEADASSKRIKVLELRGNRYIPYVKFEGKVFDVEIPQHE